MYPDDYTVHNGINAKCDNNDCYLECMADNCSLKLKDEYSVLESGVVKLYVNNDASYSLILFIDNVNVIFAISDSISIIVNDNNVQVLTKSGIKYDNEIIVTWWDKKYLEVKVGENVVYYGSVNGLSEGSWGVGMTNGGKIEKIYVYRRWI